MIWIEICVDIHESAHNVGQSRKFIHTLSQERSPTGFLFGIYTQVCRADSEVVSVARKAQSLIEKKGFGVCRI
jgi:hypothetical protein